MLEYLQKHVSNLTVIDGEKACHEIGSSKVLNMVMLGAAVKSGVLPFSVQDAENAMIKSVKPQFVELNQKALHYEI